MRADATTRVHGESQRHLSGVICSRQYESVMAARRVGQPTSTVCCVRLYGPFHPRLVHEIAISLRILQPGPVLARIRLGRRMLLCWLFSREVFSCGLKVCHYQALGQACCKLGECLPVCCLSVGNATTARFPPAPTSSTFALHQWQQGIPCHPQLMLAAKVDRACAGNVDAARVLLSFLKVCQTVLPAARADSAATLRRRLAVADDYAGVGSEFVAACGASYSETGSSADGTSEASRLTASSESVPLVVATGRCSPAWRAGTSSTLATSAEGLARAARRAGGTTQTSHAHSEASVGSKAIPPDSLGGAARDAAEATKPGAQGQGGVLESSGRGPPDTSHLAFTTSAASELLEAAPASTVPSTKATGTSGRSGRSSKDRRSATAGVAANEHLATTAVDKPSRSSQRLLMATKSTSWLRMASDADSSSGHELSAAEVASRSTVSPVGWTAKCVIHSSPDQSSQQRRSCGDDSRPAAKAHLQRASRTSGGSPEGAEQSRPKPPPCPTVAPSAGEDVMGKACNGRSAPVVPAVARATDVKQHTPPFAPVAVSLGSPPPLVLPIRRDVTAVDKHTSGGPAREGRGAGRRRSAGEGNGFSASKGIQPEPRGLSVDRASLPRSAALGMPSAPHARQSSAPMQPTCAPVSGGHVQEQGTIALQQELRKGAASDQSADDAALRHPAPSLPPRDLMLAAAAAPPGGHRSGPAPAVKVGRLSGSSTPSSTSADMTLPEAIARARASLAAPTSSSKTSQSSDSIGPSAEREVRPKRAASSSTVAREGSGRKGMALRNVCSFGEGQSVGALATTAQERCMQTVCLSPANPTAAASQADSNDASSVQGFHRSCPEGLRLVVDFVGTVEVWSASHSCQHPQ